eukprot:14801216-Heterocapsa_arctica.AAC.1
MFHSDAGGPTQATTGKRWPRLSGSRGRSAQDQRPWNQTQVEIAQSHELDRGLGKAYGTPSGDKCKLVGVSQG